MGDYISPSLDMDVDSRAKSVVGKKITSETVIQAAALLRKYKDGKIALEKRIINNEQWWKARHWDQIVSEKGIKDESYEQKLVSAHMFNNLQAKHADYMDSYPEPTILPREEGDRQEADMLSHIVPVILEQNNYEQVYSDKNWYKLIKGGAITGVFWDSSKLGGLGDISVKKIDILNVFWKPGITDIQESDNVFHTNLVSNKILEQRYPQLEGKLGGNKLNTAKYIYDENIDTSDMSVVVDWYYHTEYNGRKVLQYCKFVNDEVLYATENDNEVPTRQEYDAQGNIVEVPYGEPMSERGWYDHTMYPFVCETDFPVEGSLFGFSLLDLCKDPQTFVDLADQAILKNMRITSKPRWAVRSDSGLNEDEFLDYNNPLVHFEGNLGEDAFRQIFTQPMNPSLDIINSKINEMKETTGNNDVNSGSTPSGVTSGSAISALQEQAGKTSRDQNMSNYRAYSEVVKMIIELIKQFYDIPRQFRIVGDKGQYEFINYSNKNIKPKEQGNEFGIDMGMKESIFDIKVSAQKQNPYSKLSQNELALQFYNAGFFNPQMADQALATLDIMDFDGKEEVIKKIEGNSQLLAENMQLKQQLIMMAKKMDAITGTTMANDLTIAFSDDHIAESNKQNAEFPKEGVAEHPFNERARERTLESTMPR